MDSAPLDAGWTLDPTLERDTAAVGNMPLSRILLSRDANYPWLLVVPRRNGVSELIDLGPAERAQLMIEIAEVSRALKAATRCDKLNVAAIGNVVPQLHIHVIARFRADAAWPRPVWNVAPARAYDQPAMLGLLAALRGSLAGLEPLVAS